MRSPPGARFPALSAMSAALLVTAAACTPGTEPEPAATPSSPPQTAIDEGGDAHLPSPREGGRGRARVASVRDRDHRRTVRGQAPPYVEIDSASVEGSPDALQLGVTLAGHVPQRMPDRSSILRVTFTLTTADGRRFTFEAQCIRPGWGAFASGGPQDAPVPEIAVGAQRVELTVDPAYMGGLQPFKWLANVAWTSGEANYAFDAAPKRGYADYP